MAEKSNGPPQRQPEHNRAYSPANRAMAYLLCPHSICLWGLLIQKGERGRGGEEKWENIEFRLLLFPHHLSLARSLTGPLPACLASWLSVCFPSSLHPPISIFVLLQCYVMLSVRSAVSLCNNTNAPFIAAAAVRGCSCLFRFERCRCWLARLRETRCRFCKQPSTSLQSCSL